MEKFTSQKARSAIQALMQLNPARVTVLRGGAETTVPLAGVLPGELVVIRTGERVAVDGVVVRGTAALNEASLTGESLPVEKGVGDPVYAGSASYFRHAGGPGGKGRGGYHPGQIDPSGAGG